MREFVIIGCGRFGQSVAKTLYERGYEVLALDKREDRIQEIADDVTHAIQLDAIDEASLRSVSISNIDVAVISIGADIQASILATLIVKELGVKKVIAKARNDVHARVLKKIGADEIIFPERDMGIKLAKSLATDNILDYIELDTEYSVVEIKAFKEWNGKTLEELKLPLKYGINIIAVKNKESGEINISPIADEIITEGDILVVIGQVSMLDKLSKN